MNGWSHAVCKCFRSCKIISNTQNCQYTMQIYNKNQPIPEVLSAHFEKICLREQSDKETIVTWTFSGRGKNKI